MIEETGKPSPEGMDLAGIHEHIHPYLLAYAVDASEENIAAILASARAVKPNNDGHVVIVLRRDIEVRRKGVAEKTNRIRLRPIRAKDYISELTRTIVEDKTFGPSLAMAEVLCETPDAIGELELDDATAVFLAMWVIRGNWFSPKT